MASRTIRVQFLPDTVANEISADAEVHDISIEEGVRGVPQILENPHVDFPGMWQLVDDDASGRHAAGGAVDDRGVGDTTDPGLGSTANTNLRSSTAGTTASTGGPGADDGEPVAAVAAGRDTVDRGAPRDDAPDAVHRYARFDQVGRTNNVRIH